MDTYRLYDTVGGNFGSANYRQIEEHIRHRRPFSGNSMHAFYSASGQYVVASYRTVIATVSAHDDSVSVAENRWGPTTGRHINLCKRGL